MGKQKAAKAQRRVQKELSRQLELIYQRTRERFKKVQLPVLPEKRAFHVALGATRAINEKLGPMAATCTAAGITDDVYQKVIQPIAACREGCHWCCDLPVAVTPPEVFTVVHFIRERFSPEEQARTLDAIRQADMQTRGMSDKKRLSTNLYCPLLRDKRCSVYEARPMMCRSYFEMDVDFCLLGRGAGVDFDPQRLLPDLQSQQVQEPQEALRGTLSGDGYDMNFYKFIPTLRAAIEDPSLYIRWSGKQLLPSSLRHH